MHPDTWPFLEALFGQHTLPEPAYLTFTAIHPGGHFPTPSRHARQDDKPQIDRVLTDLLRANQLGWGAYVAIAFRRARLGRWQRGGKADLVGLPALFVDIDDKVTGLSRLHDFNPEPSCVIDSGHGVHAYWFLQTPLSDIQLADNTLRGLAQFLGGDSKMSSAQSLRLPGTVNNKRNADGPLCQISQLCAQRRYPIAAFEPYALVSEMTETRTHRSTDSLRLNRNQFQSAIQAVADKLLCDYGGFVKRNGWIAALCPYGHGHDRPGQHFGYHPASGVGYCFGKHGKCQLIDLCQCLNIAILN